VIVPSRTSIDRPRRSAACAAVALSLLVGACSCDDSDPWRATYISTAEAAYAPPACDVDASAAATAEASGTHVDPNLVEIARLEVERDCYKGAEASLRQHLEQGPPALK
jgi:hypothetical protein